LLVVVVLLGHVDDGGGLIDHSKKP
jgi:hypothetical protein